jgi:5-aminopentanamidase
LRRGEFLGCYRKIHTNERVLTPGLETPTFRAGEVRFGINICNDANYSETALKTARAGAQILFYPLNNFLPRAVADEWRPKSPVNLVNRAMETRCWVVSSDVVGEANGWLSYGCTKIVSPRGEIISQAPEGETAVVMAELPLPQ